MSTFLFYDIETTGLNKAFDQVLQFAAIRTDGNLNEIERYELKVKLNPDVIPSPRATITHHIGIGANQSGLSEIDAIKQIHEWMNAPGTISLGYNTLEFDDEFLRFSFYRNLLTPYTHQYANQCYRMDIYPMLVMYFLYKNHVIQWPTRNDKLSLKLEDINQANHLASGRAHDAMVDVEVTLELAKKLFAEREMWNYVTGYFQKNTDQSRSQHTESLMIYSKFGAGLHYQAPVLFLGNHRHYKNQLVWLRLDAENLINPTTEQIQDYKITINKKLGEPGFILPLQERFLQHLLPERQQRAEENKRWLKQNPDVLNEITCYHTEYKYPEVPNVDAEARLYIDSFWSNDETLFCRRFHAAIPQEKVLMTERTHLKLKSLAIRLLGRHYADALTPSLAEQFKQYLNSIQPDQAEDVLIDYQGRKRLTPQVAFEDILLLRQENKLSDEQHMLLNELEAHLRYHFFKNSSL